MRFESGSRKKKVRRQERPLRKVPNWLLSLFWGHCDLVLPKLLHPFACQISPLSTKVLVFMVLRILCCPRPQFLLLY